LVFCVSLSGWGVNEGITEIIDNGAKIVLYLLPPISSSLSTGLTGAALDANLERRELGHRERLRRRHAGRRGHGRRGPPVSPTKSTTTTTAAAAAAAIAAVFYDTGVLLRAALRLAMLYPCGPGAPSPSSSLLDDSSADMCEGPSDGRPTLLFTTGAGVLMGFKPFSVTKSSLSAAAAVGIVAAEVPPPAESPANAASFSANAAATTAFSAAAADVAVAVVGELFPSDG
jgi:hypothetical protein